MRKVIDGKSYDTAAAEQVYRHDNGIGPPDFRFRAKTLYRTRHGRWFIYHEGGAMTDMAAASSGGYTNGRDIEVISDEDAFGFLAAHSEESDAATAIDEYFADRVQEA